MTAHFGCGQSIIRKIPVRHLTLRRCLSTGLPVFFIIIANFNIKYKKKFFYGSFVWFLFKYICSSAFLTVSDILVLFGSKSA